MQSAQPQRTPFARGNLGSNLGPPLPHSLQDFSVAQKHGVLMLSGHCDVLHRGASATGRRAARCAMCQWAQDAAKTRAARPRMPGASRRARRSPRIPWSLLPVIPGLLDQGLGPYGAGVASSNSSHMHMACCDHLYAFHTTRGVTVTSRHRIVIVPLHSVDGMAF